MKTVYQLKNASVGYHKKVLIHDINIDIHEGEIITLIGPNGAGKSTILKTMTKQLEEIAGTISVNGTSLKKMNYQEMAKQVSVLLTGRITPELMTNRDVVEAGRYPYTGRMGLLSSEDEQIVDETMELARISEIADRLFLECSDGQKQRVLFARALCQKPRILILDEPTSYLDIRYKLELLNTIKKLVHEEHLTVIMSLHEIDLAQKISDRVICVKGDTIFQVGTPEEVFTKDNLKKLYEIEDGSYDALTGSVELLSEQKEPKVMVISSGGSGIPIYRKLVRENIPFAAGILFDNDLDYHTAREMGAIVISAAAFSEISDSEIREAMDMVDRVERVILADVPIRKGNARLTEVIDYAEQKKKLFTEM